MEEMIRQMDLDMFEYFGESDNQYFFIADMDAGTCRWSDNAGEVFAVDCGPDGGFDWGKFVHPLDAEAFYDDCQDIQRRHTRQFCKEYRFRLRDGEYAWALCSGRMVILPSENRPVFSALITRIRVNDSFDPVTNLLYISSFREELGKIADQPAPRGIMLLGIDDFKRINDLYSYSFGDRVLADFAVRLEEQLPAGAQLFRLDGDGFGLIYPNADVAEMIRMFDKIQKIVQRPQALQNVSISFTVSGGICRYPEDGRDADTLYRNGRIAFAESKHRGKKQVTVCSAALCTRVQRRMRMLEALRESVQDGCSGFSLRFQPLIEAKAEVLYGCEVLMRWRHPNFPDGVSPYEFIPILEGSGLIFEVNKWLLREAFLQCAKWVERMPSFQMNLNISCAQFEDPEFKFLVTDMLTKTNVMASSITLELTESGAVSDMNVVNEIFSFLRSQGFKIALDDFGTGYSSLSIFQMLKVDELKIDRSFLQRLTYNVTDQALVRQIIELCHGMNMMVCVEGVESDQVIQIIRELGPEILQGFYYGHPMTDAEFEEQYFSDRTLVPQFAAEGENSPELKESMVYSVLRPTQPMSMDMIVNNAHAGIFQVAMNADFTFITCNEGYRKMLGYTARDIEVKFGNNALGIVYPDDMEYVNEEIRRQLGKGDIVTVEFRVVRSDGTPIWILGTGNVVKTADGNASLVVIILENDLLKNKQLEMERKYKRYERILGNIPVGVKCVQNNEDFDLDYMSPAFLSLLGYEEKDLDALFDRKYVNMVMEEDRPIVVSDVIEQVKSSNIITLRYRSLCKDGSTIWVETISRLCPPEEDGIQRWYSSVVNITETITEEQKGHARNFARRIQTASEQWGDVIFEYDFTNGKLSFSDHYCVLFGRKPQTEVLSEIMSIHPDDRSIFNEAIRQMHAGIQPEPVEVRYYGEKRGYFWASILFTEPSVLGDVPVSVIGRISDIDEEKKERDELLRQSQIDGVTGLLNKKSIEEEIRKVIDADANREKHYALCVLDIDDFKGINDNLGHMFGDVVLTETATRLRGVAEGYALVGRAGGDEFMLLAELGSAFENADDLGRRIVDALCRPIIYEGKKISVSASVGIALTGDETDFYTLFRLADSALYFVKAHEKGTYHVAVQSALPI